VAATASLIDFRSDTVTKPVPAMRAAMAAAEVGDDVYGEDPTVNRLEEYVADLLGKEAAVFVPTATMANQVAVLTHTERGDEMFCDTDAHIYYYEAGAPALWAGVMCHVLPHRAGVIRPDDLEAAIRPANIHHPRPRLLSLENTHNRAGGAAVPTAEVLPTVAVARRHGLYVHLDGSRLFNASVALGEDAKTLAAPADSVTICLSKGLGAPLGSLLAGPRDVIARARRYRKQLGGGMRQAGVVAAAGLYALTHHRERLADDHRRAARLAEELADIPGLSVDVPPHPTNMVMVDLADRDAESVMAAARAEGILLGAMGPRRIRLVTHLDVDDAAVERLVRFFRGAFGHARHGPV
jgi:threonine aldolase